MTDALRAYKRAKVKVTTHVIEIFDDVPPRRQEHELPQECKGILLRDPRMGKGRFNALQFDVSSFLTVRDLSTMRMVDHARSTLPLTSDDIDGRVSRCVVRRVSRLRFEFYVDELDGLMTLMTDNIETFTSLAPRSQTPAQLMACLGVLGICYPPTSTSASTSRHNACWIKTSPFIEKYILLSATQTRDDLMRGCRQDADGVETVVVKIAGAIPAPCVPRIHTKEDELLLQEHVTNLTYIRNQHAIIDAAIAYHNDAFEADCRLRCNPAFATTSGALKPSMRTWTPSFMDTARTAVVDTTIHDQYGVPFLLRHDFRDAEVLQLSLLLE